MFRLTRLPLRRCLHTAAGPVKATSYRRGFAVGLSAAALAFAIPTIALDSPLASASSPVVLEKPHENAHTETPPAPEPSSEGASGGAYNPETGEINWDCPCLGGMADGPCGEEFKAAFSCFVHSDDEPKGINCVEKFQGMQNCFREHPEVYASELMDDDEEDSAQNPSQTDEPVAVASTATSDDVSQKPKPKRKATTSPAPSSSS